MLDLMRRNANSWIMILLFAIIIFVFAVNFGPWAGQTAPVISYAVLVNDHAVTMTEFRTAYASQFARIKQFRPDYDQAQADRDGLRKMVVEQLATRELLYQQGDKFDLTVSGKDLAKEISERVFGSEEAFDRGEYERRINAYFQSSVGQFEEQVAKEVVASQINTIIGSVARVSESELLMAFKDKNTKAAIEFVKVSPKFFAVTREISDSDIKTFQAENNQKISDYYNEHISTYLEPEKIRASHILIKANDTATEAEKTAALAKINNIAERIKNGEDFAAVAKAESEDGSKDKGGDLNFFSAGMMVEEFSNAAFALKINEVSDVVKTPFGYHLIKKTDEKAKLERKLEDVSSEIAAILIKQEEQNQKAKDYATAALTKLKANSALEAIVLPDLVHAKTGAKSTQPLAPVADETDSFNRGSGYIFKIGRADKIMDVVFALTMDNRTPADVVELNGDYFALRLKSRTDADMTQFDQQKETLMSSLLYPRQRALTQQFITQLKSSSKVVYNEQLTSTADMQTDM